MEMEDEFQEGRESGRSVVKDNSEYSSRCGYCAGKGGRSVSYGMWAESLRVEDYQELLNRGWRRSGSYLYKPNLAKTCCPQYTIRLKVANFVPSKAQKKVLRRMERYLNGDYTGPMTELQIEKDSHSGSSKLADNVSSGFDVSFLKKAYDHVVPRSNSPIDESKLDKSSTIGLQNRAISDQREQKSDAVQDTCSSLSASIHAAIEECLHSGEIPSFVNIPKFKVVPVNESLRSRLNSSDGGTLLFSCSVAFPLSSQIRMLKPTKICGQVRNEKEEKELKADKRNEFTTEMAENGDDFTPQFIAEKLAPIVQKKNIPEDLFVVAVKGHLNFLTLNPSDAQKLVSPESSMNNKCSKTIVKVPLKKNARNVSSNESYVFQNGSPVLMDPKSKNAKRKLTITLAASSFIEEEFQLYKKYQIRVHQDKPSRVTRESYQRFLVDSPLIRKNFPSSFSISRPISTSLPTAFPSFPSPLSCGFGSFHQQYRIDDRLVAVGVIDILPECVSSKYLFWDPDYAFLSLGKYSALQEINLTKSLGVECPSIHAYYLGYYIHNCHKMRYKAAYFPSELLCPVRFRWVPFFNAVQVLDRVPFAPLSKISPTQLVAKEDVGLEVSKQDDLIANKSMRMKVDIAVIAQGTDGRQEQMELQNMLESCEGDAQEGEDVADERDAEKDSPEGKRAKLGTQDVGWQGDELSPEEIQEREESIQVCSDHVPISVFRNVMNLRTLLSSHVLTEEGKKVVSNDVKNYLFMVGPQVGLRMCYKLA